MFNVLSHISCTAPRCLGVKLPLQIKDAEEIKLLLPKNNLLNALLFSPFPGRKKGLFFHQEEAGSEMHS